MDPLDLIKPQIRAMQPYTLVPHPYQYKLNQNENPLGFPEELKEEVFDRLRGHDWARYPDFDLDELRGAIARHVGVEPEQVLVGNGSNELIYVTLAVTLEQGDAVVIPVPTFSVYKLVATVMGATVHEPQMAEATKFALPTDEVIALAQRERAKVVILCTPNNPTAQSYPLDALRRVCAESGALVLVDEAYQEFASQNAMGLVAEFPNVIVLRTFSKAMAMGGLRVGYAVTNAPLAQELHKGQLPYALNAFSEAAAGVALRHIHRFQAEIDQILSERTRLFAALAALPGVAPLPSDANFILTRFDRHAPKAVFAHLLTRGLLVRDVSSAPGLARFLRFSVGAPHENDALIGALAELVVN